MNGFDNQDYVYAYIISNVVALLILWAAWKRPRLGRLLFCILFGWAAVVNWTTAHRNPEFYLEYANLALLKWYEIFIKGWFSQNITEMVSLIAVCQLLIAISMVLRGGVLKTGLLGAMIFLLCIAPLGVGSAFPFSITTSYALFVIYKRDAHEWLWVNPDKLPTR